MANLSLLLVLQVVLFANGVISIHVRPSKFDFGHLARELDEQDIFGQDERGVPHLDLAKFFDRINDFADQSAMKKEIEEDSEYHPWKKEDVEKLTNLAMNDENVVSEAPTELLEELMDNNVINKALSIAGQTQKEDECPVGTIYTYMRSGKLKKCFNLTIAKIVVRLLKYKLTSPLENPPEFPTETNNLIEAIAAPVLNQPSALVVVNSLIEGLKTYNIKNPFTLTWPFLWLGNALRNKQLSLQYLAPGNVPNLTTYDGYAAFLDEYREKQRGKLFGIFPVKNFIHYPLVEDPSFEDITWSNRWQSDEVFTQQRLAGLNPMSLRILSLNDSIMDSFNQSFNWDEAMREVSGISFNEMVNSGKVFVLDYPLLQGITNIEDIEVNDPNRRPMRKTVSPITVFASVPGNNAYTGKSENTLKPVAIQMDMNK
ncbi:arachidonate 5-lipoxygenase-like, partial [Paramuricea clavata]